jgi:pimeloyl-ACP methyl ester carboxylesterase
MRATIPRLTLSSPANRNIDVRMFLRHQAILLIGTAALCGGLGARPARAVEDDASFHHPVGIVAADRIAVGDGELPLFVSRDWSAPLPGIRRAVVVLHGVLRNADVYYRSALKAQAAAGAPGAESLIIAPQFLAGIDLSAHGLSDRTLHWSLVGWEGGEPAEGPTKASSFDALDAILRRLADRRFFPDLTEIVVAGHSGGGQIAQRYAVLGRGEGAAQAAGVRVRYVVANPSSYAWFTPDRPDAAIARSCPGYDRWKYGMHDLPPYAAGQNVEALQQAFVSRQVVYLLGMEDTDPNHPALDKSCMAEAQGPQRYARGHAYFAALQARYGSALRQALHDVPGVGHNGDRMLTSACGLAALFDMPGCTP